MKHAEKYVLLAALLTPACGSAGQKGNVSTTKEVDHLEVCSLDDIPAGWVVRAHVTSNSCPGDGYSIDYWNTLVISKAADRIAVCYGSPVPEGFVRSSRTEQIGCGDSGGDYNAFIILSI